MAEKRMMITDELLAAFLDGNVNRKEVEAILQAAAEDSSLREFIAIAADVSNHTDRPKDHAIFPAPGHQAQI